MPELQKVNRDDLGALWSGVAFAAVLLTIAEELITLDELRARLAELGKTRETAARELAALRHGADRIEELERDAEAVLEGYARMTPEALDALTSEERHRFYKMLGLKVTVGADRSLEIDGAFVADGAL